MDYHVKEFYKQASDDDAPRSHFHKVIPLHEERSFSWKELSRLIPLLPKGWYELSHLETRDRIEFTRDFWFSKLPYRPLLPEFLQNFFSGLDDIGVYIFQKKFDDPFEAHLVYCLNEDSGFFRGHCPTTEEEIFQLQKGFSETILPADYLAFLQIHSGFCKSADTTGITKASLMRENYEAFQRMLEQKDPVMTTKRQAVNPKSLIPFYESFGMPFFQCFWQDWYPEQEMGNVYYSGAENTISDVQNTEELTENMAFPTFLDWLMFYLEKID